jgi:hypothetical protein
MVKYATAIRLGTASTEAILRRFNSDVTHPAYAAMLEVGRAQRTIFIARYLRDRDLQREINAGLNVVENYNGVNDYIFFGKSGELSSNRREEQEISMICLQILQSCLGYINTLMIQDTLAEPEWADRLGDADRRGLTPLFTVNMTPYGEIQLNLDRRLNLATYGGLPGTDQPRQFPISLIDKLAPYLARTLTRTCLRSSAAVRRSGARTGAGRPGREFPASGCVPVDGLLPAAAAGFRG